MFRKHPSFRRLSRFADEDLGKFDQSRIAAHLQACNRCRDKVVFVRRLRDTAPGTMHPSPPANLFDGILRRRASGERKLLPLAPPPPTSNSPVFATIAAAVVVAVGLTVLFFPTSSVRALSSDLRFSSGAPLPGQPIAVEYVPSSAFGSPDLLRLRGRYRTAEEGPIRIRDTLGRDFETLLKPNDKGNYTGVVLLPEEAVYAVFAVEDTAATHVDSNGRRMWELLYRQQDGRPLFEGLQQKFRVLESRDWEAATSVARDMAELFPESAEGWSLLLAHERQITPPADRPRLLEDHRERFASLLDAHSSHPSSRITETLALRRYARLLGDTTSREALAAKLAEEGPLHPLVVQERVNGAIRAYSDRPRDI